MGFQPGLSFFSTRQFTHRVTVTIRFIACIAKAKMPQRVERSLFEELPALDAFS